MRRRWTRVAAAGGVLTVTLLGLLLANVGGGSPDAHDAATTPSASPRIDATPSKSSAVTATPTTAPSTSAAPDEYARLVADLVFAMDTRAGTAETFRARLLDQADPGPSERGRADLERLLAPRVPAADRWSRMAANKQWSSWTTTSVYVPGTWERLVTEGRAHAGWAMRNVTGVQTVQYRDSGAWRESGRERTVTVAMRCPRPDDASDLDGCRLLLVPVEPLP
jgi:hypothetical protein